MSGSKQFYADMVEFIHGAPAVTLDEIGAAETQLAEMKAAFRRAEIREKQNASLPVSTPSESGVTWSNGGVLCTTS